MKNRIRLTESDLHRIVKESVKRILKEGWLDDEISMWDSRSNDEFGRTIKLIEKKVIELFGTSEDEYGMQSSPIGDIVAAYSLDGNRAYTAKQIYNTLENYDMIGNGDSSLDRLVKKMIRLSRV